MKVTVDVNSMTLGEIEEFEELSGTSIMEMQGGKLPAKAVSVLMFLVQRRDDPAFTLEDARAMKLADIEWGTPDPPPTAPAGS